MSKEKIEERLGLAIRKEELIEKVMLYVKREGLKYSEALMEICNEYDIDPEDIAKLVTGPLKEKLKVEAMNHNIIPNTQGNKLIGI